MAHSPEDGPLVAGSLAGSEEALVQPVEQRGSSNSRALKIAGLTTLACLLLVSQVFTAYMVVGQRDEIRSLQKQSKDMSRQLTRSSQVGTRARFPMMSSLPLLQKFALDEDSTDDKKTTSNEADMEKQLTDLLRDFNATVQNNLENMKQNMNESDWKSFESWMRHLEMFQKSHQKSATPDPASVIKTKCQREAEATTGKIGSYKPQCDDKGRYLPTQCWHATGFCWCVDENGNVIEGTSTRGRPDCQRDRVMQRAMHMPALIHKVLAADDN